MIRRPPTSTLFPYPTLSRSGSILPVAVAHGEGRAEFESPAAAAACAASGLVGFRYVNHDGSLASAYPANPSGTPFGIAALSNLDGRVTITMPHPERSFRYLQNSWRPRDAGEDSGWMCLVRNARRFVDWSRRRIRPLSD